MPDSENNSTEQDVARFNRPPRVQRPLPEIEITLPAPPVPGPPPHRNILTLLLPSLGMVLSMGLMSILTYSQSRNPLAMLPTGVMAIVSMGSALMMYRDQISSYHRNIALQDERLTRMLEIKIEEMRTGRIEENHIRVENDPPLEKIRWMIEEDNLRLWERRPRDPDFARVRIGVGETEPSVVLKLRDMDPLAPRYEEVYTLYQENRTIKNVPITVDLRQVGSLGVWGENRRLVLENVYAMITHLTTHHAPHELRIALLCDHEQATDWDWLKWVKHNEALQPDLPGRAAAIGQEAARVLLADLTNIVRPQISPDDGGGSAPADEAPSPTHYLLLIDHYNLVKDDATADYLLNNARQAGVTIIDIESDPRDVPDVCQARLEISPLGRAEFATVGPAPVIHRCQIDRLDIHQAGELARLLTNKHQARSTTMVSNIPTTVRLVDALFSIDGQKRISVDEINVNQTWSQRDANRTWAILLGWKQNNEPVWLNLLEDQDGPHGLAAGTTGAGKSVLLQSMILSLALTHSPDEINFVLIDFKGGSTAEAFRDLPHTVSVITNLQGRLVDRSLDILKAEARRRQEVLNREGVKDIATYYARLNNTPPMPRLIVIIDEFAEMAKAMPTFMDEVNSIAAIGRSLGMHLILATQKPTGVVSDKVLANLKFRVCLRVASAMDSRDMLGVADAALLPSSLPGRAYLRVGSDRFELFQSANVVYPYRPGTATAEQHSDIVVRRVGLSDGLTQSASQEKAVRAVAGQTELEVLVNNISQASEPVPRWPTPLSDSILIEQIWQDHHVIPAWTWSETERQYTFNVPSDSLAERLNITIGLIDDPHHQTQRPLRMDLANQHYLIAGAPRSGRSTALQTVIRALMVNTIPEELNISLLDFGGQNLIVFQNAPHIANIFNVNTPTHLRRFLSQIGVDLDRRAQLRATQRLDELPEILYVIDGFAALRELYPDEIDIFGRVAREGLGLGVHLIVSTDQSLAIPMKIRSNLLGRWALHQSDRTEYMDLVGRVGGTLPDALPGRGLVREDPASPVLEFQIGLPIGRREEANGNYIPLVENDIFTELQRLNHELATAWTGKKPEAIRILETAISALELPAAFCSAGQTWGRTQALPRLVIGKGDRQLDWIEIDYAAHGPNFLICGPSQSGKTNLLHTWVWNLCERYSPDEINFTLLGLRNRSLNPLAELPHVRKVVDTEFRLDAALTELKDESNSRYQKLKELVEANTDGNLDALAATLGSVHLVVVDDFDSIRFTRDRQNKLMDFIRYGRDTRTFLLLAGTSSDLLEFSDLLTYLKRGRSAFLLQAGEVEARVMDVRLSSAALRQEYPVGRGYLILGNKRELVQTICLEEIYLAKRRKLLCKQDAV